MPNPDDEPTTATSHGQEPAAPADPSTARIKSTESANPGSKEQPEGVEPVTGTPLEAPGEIAHPFEVLDGEGTADASGDDEPVDAGQPAYTAESDADDESDGLDSLDAGDGAKQVDAFNNEIEDAEFAWDDFPDEALDVEPEPAWWFPGLEGEGERTYDWPSPPGSQQRKRPLPWIDWRFSLVFPVAIIGTILTVLWSLLSSPATMEFRILDAGTGESIAGARLVVGNDVYQAGSDGVVVIERPDSPTTINVAADGYYAVHGDLDDTMAAHQDVELRLQEMSAGYPAIGQHVAIPGKVT